ncbi:MULTISPECIES: peroxiredoxin family protein [Propionibacteriales]|jgi:peroxiredoxin|uniref:peroxiredoxin family protein n=1 Tax=Propionibacteriales TaxID=85009 RepID=UPI002B1FDBC5|nr:MULTISPECIES: redoxin domain-containing protein [Propionibacteriales]MEA4944097.1 redoxin domain-containing protein [Propionicimonas sp.]MEA5155621.1 redoxin domain-containing protein [Raineyella sp.]
MPTNQSTSTTSRRQQLQDRRAREAASQAKRRRAIRLATGLVATLIVALIGFGLWSARPVQGGPSGQAPDFTLRTTAGTTVSLSDFRGKPVILYFNEGAGCGSCTQQMALIEQNPGFAEAGITVLPIVMNTAAQIQPDLDTFGVTTPYLLDDGTVSKAYDTLGKGMHPGMPGHGFILIDEDGNQLWHGNYPSMYLDPAELLQEATSRL